MNPKFITATLWLASLGVAAATGVGGLMNDRQSTYVQTDRGVLSVSPINNDVFEVMMIPEGAKLADFWDNMTSTPTIPDVAEGLMTPVLANPFDRNNGDVNVTANTEYVFVTSPTTQVVINRKTGVIGFYDKEGNLLLKEAEGLDNNSEIKRASFITDATETFFGAGERGHSLSLNGDTLVMYNRQNYGYTYGDPRISQMNITMPYLVSDKGYGLLMNDYNAAQMVVGDTIVYTTENPSMPLYYYFINGGGSLAGTTEKFTEITGRQDLPPFWALGYITSKYGYKTQDETLGVIDTLKNNGYPVDGIVLDLYWYGQEKDMGRFEWNKEQFPDHKQMLKQLKDNGVNTVIISQPYIHKDGAIDNYNYLSERGMLVKDEFGKTNDVTIWIGDVGMLDVSNEKTRQWLWNRYRNLTLEGVEGWWGDLGEPEVHPLTIVHENGKTAAQYHNVYGNEWSRIIYEGFREDFPEKRLMTLMRGGTTGLQRYNVFPWSTDVLRSWGGLQPQVNIMLNSGLSGLGYMSSDIGGFAVDPANPTDEELYVRWLQLGTFNPILRTHAQLKPEPYNYPNIENISKRYIKMRYEWLPYNYTLAYENAAKGYPLVRPLNFSDTDNDGRYANIEDEYMWGDEVLVAPVMKKGARSRKVVFPGGEWYDWFEPTLKYKGNTTATVKVPLDKLPLYVKAGSFIPQYTLPIENTTQYNPQFLTVRYFPSAAQTEYVLFDDDRKSPTSLADGAYQLTTFIGQQTSAETKISINSSENAYASMPPFRVLTLEVVDAAKAPKSVVVNNDGRKYELVNAADKDVQKNGVWSYDKKNKTLSIRFAWDYGNTDVVVNW